MSARLKQHAAELLRRGLDPQRVADLTTLPLRRVHELATGRTCDTDWCGHKQDGPDRPRAGSIRVHQTGNPGGRHAALWFCSWGCVTAHATTQAAA